MDIFDIDLMVGKIIEYGGQRYEIIKSLPRVRSYLAIKEGSEKPAPVYLVEQGRTPYEMRRV